MLLENHMKACSAAVAHFGLANFCAVVIKRMGI